jgi:methylated-DNA-protein-cysteine methyltransferase-like protein
MDKEYNEYNEFTKRVIQIIKSIPPGQVMTYGDIALMAGNPKAARQVSRLLHSLSEKHDLPWHRVVNKSKKISLSGTAGEIQKKLLEDEGVFLTREP